MPYSALGLDFSAGRESRDSDFKKQTEGKKEGNVFI